MHKFFLLILFFITISTSYGQSLLLYDLKNLFPNSKVQTLPSTNHFQEEYIITLKQKLDHHDDKVGFFPQRIFLSHHKKNSPMVLNISGYAAKYEISQISQMLEANQIVIEYRFYGKSRIDSIQYKYLTNDQAVNDIHTIITKLKKIYTGKWLSTGISKGATTCLIHKTSFPEDVHASIVFSAPMLTSCNDFRINNFMETVGTSEIRDVIFAFQKEVLKNIDSIENLMNIDFFEYSFMRIGGIYNALQYAILDFPYIYWQMGHSSAIFDRLKAPLDYYNVLKSVVNLLKFCDDEISKNQTAYYQFYTENGFYEYSETLKHKLGVKDIKNNIEVFLPPNIEIKYNPYIILNTIKKLNKNNYKIIFIYGENDPWVSTSLKPPMNDDSLFIISKNKSHNIKINELSNYNLILINKLLNDWMN